jgi:TolB-like protein
MTIWSAEIKDLEKFFDSFKDRHPSITRELGKLIKADDENMVLVYSRRCLEVIITDLSERELKRDRGTEPLKGIIDKLNRGKKVPHNIIISMQNLNSLSTLGAHPKDFDTRQVKPVLLDLTTILDWYLQYLKAHGSIEGEVGSVQGERKEPAGLIKSKSKPGKRIIMVTSVLLAAAIIIVSLIVFNFIGGGKMAKAGSIGSIVVLPFSNYTGQDTLEWFVSGMHSSLIQDMGKLGSLHIPGTTTSQVFKGSDKTIKEITSELKVDAALETAVLCLGEDTICFQTRLIKSGGDEEQLWIADYRVARNQILNWYNGVTKQIAKEIKIELTAEEERLLSKSRIVDREAYDSYLLGLYFLEDFSLESLNKARDHLKSAIEKDPDWAPLYAGLAKVWIGIAQTGFESPTIAYQNVYDNLDKALRLDPDLSDAHFISGMSAYLNEWDWTKGEKELVKALAINPNDVMSRIYYAQLLGILQRPDEAITQGQLAIELDPLNPLTQILYSYLLIEVDDCVAALAQLEKVIAVDPENFIANNVVECAAYRCKDYNKTFEATKNSTLNVINIEEDAHKEIERIFNEQGFVAAYEEIMSQWEVFVQGNPDAPVAMAIGYIYANQPDKAMDWIEKGFEIHDPNMPYIATPGYNLDPLFGNPRFINIVKKMNLPLPKNN